MNLQVKMRKENWDIPTLGGKARSKAKGKRAWCVGGERSSSVEDPLYAFSGVCG